MLRQLRAAVVAFLALTLLTGVVYPLLVTLVAETVFARQANGSLIEKNGQVVGSRLLGQPFDDPKYMWGRLSATSPFAYNAGASSGSNLGPTNPALTAAAKARTLALRAADPGNDAPVPVDLVTASGSGLDPHISPAAAEFQASRVARARGVDVARVRESIAKYTEQPTFGVLGEARVDVVGLNSALDDLH